jgi:hypothetical protein
MIYTPTAIFMAVQRILVNSRIEKSIPLDKRIRELSAP